MTVPAPAVKIVGETSPVVGSAEPDAAGIPTLPERVEVPVVSSPLSVGVGAVDAEVLATKAGVPASAMALSTVNVREIVSAIP